MSSMPFRLMLKPSILMSREVGREVSTPVTARCESRMDSFLFASPAMSSAAMLLSTPLRTPLDPPFRASRFASLCRQAGAGALAQYHLHACVFRPVCVHAHMHAGVPVLLPQRASACSMPHSTHIRRKWGAACWTFLPHHGPAGPAMITEQTFLQKALVDTLIAVQ